MFILDSLYRLGVDVGELSPFGLGTGSGAMAKRVYDFVWQLYAA